MQKNLLFLGLCEVRLNTQTRHFEKIAAMTLTRPQCSKKRNSTMAVLSGFIVPFLTCLLLDLERSWM